MKNILFITDPIKNFDPIAETTSFLVHELCKRKYNVFIAELKDITLQKNQMFIKSVQVKTVIKNKAFTYQIIKTIKSHAKNFSAIFLRKDPPVDLTFLDHLSLNEFLSKQTLLVNHPSGIKRAGGEKLFALNFPDCIPQTIISSDMNELSSFIKKHKVAILKPLNGSGGKGIIQIEAKSPSINSILEVLTDNQKSYIMAQKFIPEVKKGDKRILLVDGKVLGAFLRVPSKKDFRGNLHSGASFKKCSLTSRDKEIIQKITPTLKELGLYFVGLDIIGDFVTEINFTSPMGIREINTLYNVSIEKDFIDWLVARLSNHTN